MKNENILALILALVIGGSGGYALSQATHSHEESSSEVGSHSHNDDENAVSHMSHQMLMIDAEGAPSVALDVSKDAKSGWNVSIKTSDYTFTPDNVNQANVANEGHAHLYIDGKKVARVYSDNIHIDGYDDAKVFRVTLNANDHSEYATQEGVIDAEFLVK